MGAPFRHVLTLRIPETFKPKGALSGLMEALTKSSDGMENISVGIFNTDE
jgi:hypothetical protein